MGNDNEIKQLVRHESESFLKKAQVYAKAQRGAYDFQAEFAKTRRNRSFVVVGASAITILILGIAAIAVTRMIERSVARTPVDVAAFDDLNLKDLLDSSKRNEDDLSQAKLALSQIDSDLSSSLASADRDYQASVESIRMRALPKAQENQQVAAAAAVWDAAEKKLRADHDSAAAKKRDEIVSIQKRIDQYDSRSLARAKAEESTLANERTAFDIEKQQEVQVYEARIADLQAARKRDIDALTRQKNDLAAAITARYNPTFADARSATLLSGWKAPSLTPPQVFHPYLGPAGVLDSASESSLDQSYSDLSFLSNELQAVPYINSVPAALSRIATEAESSIAAYRKALQAAGSGLEDRDKKIAALTTRAEAAETTLAQYRAAVIAYARGSRESGFVIDAHDSAKLVVCLDPGASVQDGYLGYLIRGDKAVATVSFALVDGIVYAKVIQVAEGEAPQAFDSILVAAIPPEAAK